MSKPTKSNLQVRIRQFDRPYRGERKPAKDYPGMLPYATPWPWQVREQPKQEDSK